MMRKQTCEFIAGCVFTKMEATICKELKRIPATADVNTGNCELIPKIWFGLPCYSKLTNDITVDEKFWLKEKLGRLMEDVFPKFEITITNIVPDAQYIRFDYNVVKKAPVKKITVEQIEKELGYKIEIVSDK